MGHVYIRGESRGFLYSIATKYQVNMDSIRIINGLKTDQLVPGQDLLIPIECIYCSTWGFSIYNSPDGVNSHRRDSAF